MNHELSRRAVACPRWRWMPGMRLTIAYDNSLVAARIVSVGRDGFSSVDERGHEHGWYHLACVPARDRCLPDLDDAATRGCLLALVREAAPGFGTGVIHVRPAGRGWAAFACGQVLEGTQAPTEAETLVAALESADATSTVSPER